MLHVCCAGGAVACLAAATHLGIARRLARRSGPQRLGARCAPPRSGSASFGEEQQRPSLALTVYSAARRTPFDVLDDAARLDPYAILRIPFLSGRQRIRAAYAELCRSEHPDKHMGAESLEWQMGVWAYRVLMDPKERASYDSQRIVRKTLSVTEGVFAFGFAVIQHFGTFVGDLVDLATREVQRINFTPWEPWKMLPSGSGAPKPGTGGLEPPASITATTGTDDVAVTDVLEEVANLRAGVRGLAREAKQLANRAEETAADA